MLETHTKLSLNHLGDDYIATAYSYYYSHVWRNFGILLGFLFAFMALYFICVELNSETTSTVSKLMGNGVTQTTWLPRGVLS